MLNHNSPDLNAVFRSRAFGLVSFAALVLLVIALLVIPSTPLFAAGGQRSVTVTVETIEYIEYYEDGDFSESGDAYAGSYGFSQSPALASYGPFHVVARDRVEMIGEADSYSPADFRQLLADWPQIRTLVIVDCAGTVDDNANLELARMIRTAGIATHVPATGSVRSGGVELFLAGVQRTAEPGAEFIVHSWRDNYGREAADYPASHDVHAPYLRFYRNVGMTADRAQAFYALTNSVPHNATRQLSLADLSAFGLLH